MGFFNTILNPIAAIRGRTGGDDSIDNITKSAFFNANPRAMSPFYNPKKDQSMDQIAGDFFDPAHFFGKKEESSYLGESRLDKNLADYELNKPQQPAFQQLVTNPAAEQFKLGGQPNQMAGANQSTYAALINKRGY